MVILHIFGGPYICDFSCIGLGSGLYVSLALVHIEETIAIPSFVPSEQERFII